MSWLRRGPRVEVSTYGAGVVIIDQDVPDDFEAAPMVDEDETWDSDERRIRARIADEIHQLRHRRGEHQPDSWFWAMTHAERVIRGGGPHGAGDLMVKGAH